MGTHEQLIDRHGIYYRLIARQQYDFHAHIPSSVAPASSSEDHIDGATSSSGSSGDYGNGAAASGSNGKGGLLAGVVQQTVATIGTVASGKPNGVRCLSHGACLQMCDMYSVMAVGVG